MSFFLLTAGACNQVTDNRRDGDILTELENGKAEISFREYEHDFGKVKEGEKVAAYFHSVIPEKQSCNRVVSASCECTVPKYDKKQFPREKWNG